MGCIVLADLSIVKRSGRLLLTIDKKRFYARSLLSDADKSGSWLRPQGSGKTFE